MSVAAPTNASAASARRSEPSGVRELVIAQLGTSVAIAKARIGTGQKSSVLVVLGLILPMLSHRVVRVLHRAERPASFKSVFAVHVAAYLGALSLVVLWLAAKASVELSLVASTCRNGRLSVRVESTPTPTGIITLSISRKNWARHSVKLRIAKHNRHSWHVTPQYTYIITAWYSGSPTYLEAYGGGTIYCP